MRILRRGGYPRGRHTPQSPAATRFLPALASPLEWSQTPAWWYLTELPQGRKAARAGELFQVRGGSSTPWAGVSGEPTRLGRVSTALYRRYRPESFADVIGQDHVTEPLMQALRTGRVSHAYLFSGPRGCGKTTSARILARCLNCEQGPTPIPCGVCDSCVALARDGSGSVDVTEIDGASHGGVDLDDIDTAGAVTSQRDAGVAHPARDRGRPLLAVQATGQDPGRSRLAATAWPAEQVRVADPTSPQRLHQGLGHVILTDDVGKGLGPVAAVQRCAHALNLVGSTDCRAQAHGRAPRVPGRAHLPLLPSGPGGVR